MEILAIILVVMLSYIKAYRKLRGGKWYKVAIYNTIFKYYTRTKPNKVNHHILKYRY